MRARASLTARPLLCRIRDVTLGRRDVALILLEDPELRLRVCHLEELLRGRQQKLAASQVANGGQAIGALQLQSALADRGFAALFCLDSSVTEPDWGMQVRGHGAGRRTGVARGTRRWAGRPARIVVGVLGITGTDGRG